MLLCYYASDCVVFYLQDAMLKPCYYCCSQQQFNRDSGQSIVVYLFYSIWTCVSENRHHTCHRSLTDICGIWNRHLSPFLSPTRRCVHFGCTVVDVVVAWCAMFCVFYIVFFYFIPKNGPVNNPS